jgi:pantoate--beta-alanine ligase
MDIARTSGDVRALLTNARRAERSIALVPTMGAFHDGHLSLMRAARQAYDVVVVSIFVNPLQFGPREDLSTYPRDERSDLALAENEKVDIIFLPSVEEMYPAGHVTRIDPGPLGHVLEGADRPGHFEGVATIVGKLLNVVRPQGAFFGQKDAQQVAVVRRITEDLLFGVRIEVCDTVRDRDGLALSSRNAMLSEPDRARAVVLSRALEAGCEALEDQQSTDAAEEAMVTAVSAVAGIDLRYARAVDPDTFGAPMPGRDILLVIAARLGGVRLIDNKRWTRCS